LHPAFSAGEEITMWFDKHRYDKKVILIGPEGEKERKSFLFSMI